MQILNRILTDKKNRKNLIKEFQNQVWNDENANEILSILAYDLDFYEPDERLRFEDSCYYGEERLEQEIKMALQKLNDSDHCTGLSKL